MNDDEHILACPECDHGGPRERNPEHPSSTATAKYYCTACHASFDEPIKRPKKKDSGLTGLARELYQADVEEVL